MQYSSLSWRNHSLSQTTTRFLTDYSDDQQFFFFTLNRYQEKKKNDREPRNWLFQLDMVGKKKKIAAKDGYKGMVQAGKCITQNGTNIKAQVSVTARITKAQIDLAT